MFVSLFLLRNSFLFLHELQRMLPNQEAELFKLPQVQQQREEWLKTHFSLHHGNLPVCRSHWTMLMQLQALTFSFPLH